MTPKASSMALDIWMKINIEDCAKRKCPLCQDSTFEDDIVCMATSEQKCPEVRRQLWSLKKSIVNYYIKPGAKKYGKFRKNSR